MKGDTLICRPTGESANPMGRKLVLVDLDNLSGMRDLGPAEWRELLRHLWIELGTAEDDQVIISMCRHTMAIAMPVLVGVPAQLLARDGKDGAEIAIRDAVNIRHAAERFEVLVIASGDHFFTQMARQAQRRHMYIWQVCSTRAGCAMTLRRTADRHSQLDPSRLWVTRDEGRLYTHAEAS